MNRYEIHAALRERRDTLPSPSTIYRVLKRYQLNRRTPAMREEKRRIIKDKLGELGHVDLHQLSRDIFLAADGSAGDSHVATGVVPRVVNEFAMRGVRVDTNLFKKAR